MKNPLWLSLPLLTLAYGTFSWFLYHATVTWVIWTIAVIFTVGQALMLTAFSDGFRSLVSGWLRSDAGYFTSVIIAAMFVAIAFVWIKIFGYVLVLIAAEILARLDLQNMGCNQSQSLALLTLFSFAGLALGWTASQYFDFNQSIVQALG